MTLNKYLSILHCLALFICKAQQTTPASSTIGANHKKNILFIAIDDLKPLLSNYGSSQM